MKILFFCLIGFVILPFFCFAKDAPSVPGQPFTLYECYKLALKQSELIAINSELINQAQAHFLEAIGTIMPQVSFSHTETRNHSQGFSSLNKTYEGVFVFKQALFSGFKEFAGMAGSHLEKSQRENEKLRAEQLLFVDVSDAFYLLKELNEDIAVLENIQKAFGDRITELKSRVDLGKSRTSEVVSTEVQFYTLLDQLELVKSQQLIANELLDFLTGRHIDRIIEPEIDFALKPESEYLAQASWRPDVLAANFAWQADKKRVTVAKSGFLPTINLEGDYFTHRNSAPADSRWEALLTIDVPIFEGTTIYGQVKEAVSLAKESELLFNRSGRVAVQDIHDSYVNTQADYARRTVLEKALNSAELNYKLQLQDYQLSVVNNLDVLAAIQNLENVRRNYIHISCEGRRFYWQLLAAAGEIKVEVLK